MLSNKFHTVAYSIDSEVSGECECLEDVDFFVTYSEHAWTCYFAEYGYLIVGHAYCDDRVFLAVEIAYDTIVDELLTFSLGQPSHF